MTKNLWANSVIISAAIYIRLTAYGDLRLSVANSDTPSYVDSSRVDLLTWNAFTSYRPFTTNLVYKIFMPDDGYRYQALSNIANGAIKRKIDRGFKNIAVLQSVVSIIAWAALAWVFSSRLKSSIAKVTVICVVMLFGFTPQIADWDGIMSSESLSISLFVTSFTILLWVAFAFHDNLETNFSKVMGGAIRLQASFFGSLSGM